MIFWIAYFIIVLLGYWVMNWVYPGFDPTSWYGGAFTALVGLTVLSMKEYVHFEIEYVDDDEGD